MIKWLKRDAKVSYSQCGEDIIVAFIFEQLKINKPTYLDIGAHHPSYINNTFLLYEKGCVGVSIEPDPILFKKIQKVRARDTCLNIGIGIGNEDKAKLYIMSSKTLNTFSQSEAERYESFGTQKIEATIDVALLTVNQVIEKYFKKCPNFISLDIEGLDFDVIKTFNFDAYKPEVFCIETITYTENKTEEKRKDIIEYMALNGYESYADTFINTIFVNRESWKNR